jgi:ribonuclease G
LGGDHAKTSVGGISPLGLVEMTRKRTRESLERQLCDPCPACQGRGWVRSVETVCHDIFREIRRQAPGAAGGGLMVLAHQEVVARLLDEAAGLAGLEAAAGRPVRLQAESSYALDRYDVSEI